jgi:hypothetical protein
MLRQDIGWFDERSNAVGVLTARLSVEANQVRNVCTSCLDHKSVIAAFFFYSCRAHVDVCLSLTFARRLACS